MNKPGKSWDAYTVLDAHVSSKVLDLVALGQGMVAFVEQEVYAVGCTTGLMAIDADISNKVTREERFPTDLIEKGTQFCCRAAAASVPQDKERIKSHIGEAKLSELDAKLSGFMAATVLERALRLKGGYLDAVRHGMVRNIGVNLLGSKADTECGLCDLFMIVDGRACETFALQSRCCKCLADVSSDWTSLTSLDLSHCGSLLKLSSGAANWIELVSVKLRDCVELVALPVGVASWTHLTSLDATNCSNLMALPDGVVKWT